MEKHQGEHNKLINMIPMQTNFKKLLHRNRAIAPVDTDLEFADISTQNNISHNDSHVIQKVKC